MGLSLALLPLDVQELQEVVILDKSVLGGTVLDDLLFGALNLEKHLGLLVLDETLELAWADNMKLNSWSVLDRTWAETLVGVVLVSA